MQYGLLSTLLLVTTAVAVPLEGSDCTPGAKVAIVGDTCNYIDCNSNLPSACPRYQRFDSSSGSCVDGPCFGRLRGSFQAVDVTFHAGPDDPSPAPPTPTTTKAPPAPTTTAAPPAPTTTAAPPVPTTTAAPPAPTTTAAPPAPTTTAAPGPTTTKAPEPTTTKAPAPTTTKGPTTSPGPTPTPAPTQATTTPSSAPKSSVTWIVHFMSIFVVCKVGAYTLSM